MRLLVICPLHEHLVLAADRTSSWYFQDLAQGFDNTPTATDLRIMLVGRATITILQSRLQGIPNISIFRRLAPTLH